MLHRIFHKIADERGNALVESALLLSIFGTPFLGGIVDLGLVLHSNAEVQEAANAGASYAMMSLANSTDSAITTAAQGAALDLGSSLKVTAEPFYVCSKSIDGLRYPTQGAAAVVCPAAAANHYLYFVQVTTAAAVPPLIRLPGLPQSFNLSGKSVMEVEE